MQIWLLMTVVSLLFFGITGVTQKLGTNHVSSELSFFWFCVAMVAISAAVPLFVPLDWHIGLPVMAFAALGGLLNGLGALTSLAALERGGKASVIIPIINLYPLVTIAGAWLFLGEKLSARQVVGVACALVAVVLLSQESSPAQS